MAQRLLRFTAKPESLLQYVADRPGHDRRYALDSRKIESELGWKPEISLEDGVCQTIEWYKNNNKWVSDIRADEYLSYYEKYYDDRENSLKAVADSGSKLPA